MQNTRETMKDRIGPDHPQYSASYGDVCRAVDREVELREQLQAAVTEARGQVIAEIRARIESLHPRVAGDNTPSVKRLFLELLDGATTGEADAR